MLLSIAAIVGSPASEKPITVPLLGHQVCKGSGSVVKYDKPEVAGEAAAKAVLAKCPQLALTCANVTGEALALPPRSAWQLA